MVSSRYGVDTKGFDFSRLPREYDGMDTQVFKGELGTMRDVLGEIQNDMYKSCLLYTSLCFFKPDLFGDVWEFQMKSLKIDLKSFLGKVKLK